MAFGAVGGIETWRNVSMVTPSSGTISISKGDAVGLVATGGQGKVEGLVFAGEIGAAGLHLVDQFVQMRLVRTERLGIW